MNNAIASNKVLVRAFYYRLWNQWDFAAANTHYPRTSSFEVLSA